MAKCGMACSEKERYGMGEIDYDPCDDCVIEYADGSDDDDSS
jgi:hypothetical protein